MTSTGSCSYSFCTPDDGCGWHPKHVERTCRIINRLLCVASRWIITNINYRVYMLRPPSCWEGNLVVHWRTGESRRSIFNCRFYIEWLITMKLDVCNDLRRRVTNLPTDAFQQLMACRRSEILRKLLQSIRCNVTEEEIPQLHRIWIFSSYKQIILLMQIPLKFQRRFVKSKFIYRVIEKDGRDLKPL